MGILHKRFSFISQLLFLSFGLAVIFFAGSGNLYKQAVKTQGAVISSDTLPAFPGAEGFGSMAKGGRGGRVIEVTNLNNSGTGSFRQAVVVETGPRIVVFRVGGVINLTSDVEIREPYLTVAGQTAPGEGIVLRGARLGVRTHDVIIRGMKVRPGDDPGGNVNTRDGIAITVDPNTKAEVYNVIVDHNSISWGLDENTSIWDNTHGMEGVKLHDVTYSWNIISEALRCAVYTEPNGEFNCSRSGGPPFDRVVHGFGMLIGEDAKNVSIHHNLIANNDFRNPAITQGVSLEFINNVVYNYGLASMSIPSGGNTIGPDTPDLVNIIGNYFKPSAGTLKKSFEGRSNATIKGIEVKCNLPSGSKVHAKGNIDAIYRPTDSGDEWNAVYFEDSCRSSLIARARSNSSALSQTGGVSVTSAQDAYLDVLEKAGALGQGVDLVDARAVNTTKLGTSPVTRQIIQGPGSRNNWFIDTPNEAGTNPTYPTTSSALTDNDRDGMPDLWEQTRGGNLNPSSTAPSGYTWVEEYINSLLPVTGLPPSPPTPVPTGVAPTPPPTLVGCPESLFSNPCFENGTTGWTFNQGNAVAAFTTTTSNPYGGSGKSGQITITQTGSNPQLYKYGFNLTQGASYRLTFAARSNTGRDMNVHILKHTSPYTLYELFKPDLTSSWQTFSYDFSPSDFSGTTNDTRFRFWTEPHDEAGDQYFVDNVSLTLLSGGAQPTPMPTSVPTVIPTQAPSNITIQALMDAYVDSGSPNTNYNGNLLASQVSSTKQISYIKFDLSSVTSVRRAVLRIRVSNSSGSSHTVNETTDDWGEATITYNTRKNMGNTLATFTPNSSGWREIDITPYISSKKGLSRASVAIQTTNTDDLEFSSSEGQYPPEILITY